MLGVENRGKISDFWPPPPVKIRAGVGKMFQSIFQDLQDPTSDKLLAGAAARAEMMAEKLKSRSQRRLPSYI